MAVKRDQEECPNCGSDDITCTGADILGKSSLWFCKTCRNKWVYEK